MNSARTPSEIIDELDHAVTHYKESEIKEINELIHSLYLQRSTATKDQIADGLERISFLVLLKEIKNSNFDEIEALHAEFAGHSITISKQKADWSYKRLQAVRKKLNSMPEIKSIPDIMSYEIKEEDKKHIFNYISSHPTLPFEKIYKLYPFHQDERYQNPKNVLNCVLMWLDKSVETFQYRKAIFLKVCDALISHQDQWDHNTVEENAHFLNLMIKLIMQGFRPSFNCMTQLIERIHSHLKEADQISVQTILYAYAKLAEIFPFVEGIINGCIVKDAITFLHEQRKQLTLETLFLTSWSVAKLVFLKKYTDLNIQHFQELQDQAYIKIKFMDVDSVGNAASIQHFLWSYVKVMEAGLDITVDEGKIPFLIKTLHDLRYKACAQEISISLWSISKLIEIQELKTITFEGNVIDNLVCMFLNRASKNPEEITDLLYAIAIFVKEDKVSALNGEQIKMLFNQLTLHPYSTDECKTKGLWAVIKMIEKGKLKDILLLDLEKIFLNLDETYRRKNCLAREVGDYFVRKSKNNNHYTNNQRDPLFSPANEKRFTSVTPTPLKRETYRI